MALIFEQLFDRESSTFTYLVGDGVAGVGVLIDPGLVLCAPGVLCDPMAPPAL